MADEHKQEDKFVRNMRIGLLISFGILLIAGLLWFVGPTTPTEKKDFVQTLAILIAGVVGLAGLYFTWRNLDQTRSSTQETLRLTHEGQITERFTRAIDQLGETDNEGKKKLEIRLGGIYALERIAKDSPADYPQIIAVLTAYVRENAPWHPKESSTAPKEVAVQDKADMKNKASPPSELPTDIRAIVEVLTRLSLLRDSHASEGYLASIDLRSTNLQGADFQAADLHEANLQGANLQRAILIEEANLQGAYLIRANLQGANLWKADLWAAILHEAFLQGADLVEANLSGAIVTEEQLDTARSLEGATMPDGSEHD